MEAIFVCYPKCSTCQKAQKWLDAKGVEYRIRHIVEDHPNKEEIEAWHKASGLPLKRFFNTSGMNYRALGLKDQLPKMTEEEQYAILSTDGMLVKRPILITQKGIVPGFKEKDWENIL
ncbi:MAG: arsenate reductase family protein [Clostridiales bacterium]|nr:arsenate reductase family protein [Clostridiales bacterium]